MSKLFEWLTVLGFLGVVWLSLLFSKIENSFARQHPDVLFWSPFIFIGFFGTYAASVILYRVFTFNNCENAAAELHEEIMEARANLAKLGFKFKTKSSL